MYRLYGQSVPRVRRLSPVVAVLVVVAVVALIALFFVVAMVAIPLAIVAGLGVAGYRALTGAARTKTNELLNRDDAGRHNVKVLRSSPDDVAEQP